MPTHGFHPILANAFRHTLLITQFGLQSEKMSTASEDCSIGRKQPQEAAPSCWGIQGVSCPDCNQRSYTTRAKNMYSYIAVHSSYS